MKIVVKRFPGTFGSGRFCNHSCKTSFINRHRKLSEEGKKKLSEHILERHKELKIGRFKEKPELPKYCEKCGKEITERFGSGRFCSKSCSNSRVRSEESKKKVSKSLKEYYKTHEQKGGGRSKSDKIHRHRLNKDNVPEYRRCVICGNLFKPGIRPLGKISSSTTCSPECHHKLASKVSRLAKLKQIANGTFKGWMSRNILSYPEKFFREVP